MIQPFENKTKSMRRSAIACGVTVIFAGLIAAFPAGAADGISVGQRGLEFKSENGAVRGRIGGRIHLDFANYKDDVTVFDDRNDIRRLRVYVAATVFDDLTFRIDRDVGGTSTGWKSLWLRYRPTKRVSITGGNFIAPFGLEDLMSSNNIPLMERALTNVLTPGFYLGVQVATYGRNWTAAAGYFDDPLDKDADKKASNGHGFVGRVTFAPVRNRRQVVHLGAAIEYRNLDATRGLRLRSRPESGITSVRLIDSGLIAGADDFTNIGLEAAWRNGPFMVQGEYIRMELDRTMGAGLTFSGWYVQAAYVLTGERRRYSRRRGAFGDIRPKSKWGALEIAARFSTLDLNDKDILGGEERNVTIGLNWYLLRNFRAMFNYVRAEADPNRNGLKETPDIFQARLQLKF